MITKLSLWELFSKRQDSQFSHMCDDSGYYCFLIFDNLKEDKSYLIVVLICISLMTKEWKF